MSKPLTVNEMIYKTLTTKITKVPKYKDVLEALGYILDKDHDWSVYDYWGIKMAESNHTLLISKGYDNQRRLYKTATHVETKDISKVDFVNLIKTDRSATRWYNRRMPETKIQQYKGLKKSYRSDLSICESYKQKIIKVEEQLEEEKERLKHWEEIAAKDKNKLDELVATIKRREKA